jgi:2-dehydro-3-deoxygalactonokinase
MSRPALLALDWGSSQLRAHLLDDNGALLAERSSADGASRMAAAAAFEPALQALAGDWLREHPALAVLACGMVGSAHGWREAPYLPCPAALDTLASHCVAVPLASGHTLRIVPGLLDRSGGTPDVMRGEETQLAGLQGLAPAAGSVVVMPGTHSKWVWLEDGRVERFHTCMTGELYALLREHSVLARLMAPAPGFDEAAFLQGAAHAATAGPQGLPAQLFAVRTLGLFDELPRTALADHLSGLLIGNELAAMAPLLPAGAAPVLVGETALCRRYSLALHQRGLAARQAPPALAAHGLWALARQAGWA